MSALDRFVPRPDVAERHDIRVRAPVHVTYQAACEFDVQSLVLVKLLFAARARAMGGRTPAAAPPRMPFLAWARSLGWGVLEEQANQHVVMGAVCQPWVADVRFRSVPAADWDSFSEPGLVKIAWTLEVTPLEVGYTRLATETRVVATDATARAKFLPYWRWARFGIIPIRWMALPAIRREAERRATRTGGLPA